MSSSLRSSKKSTSHQKHRQTNYSNSNQITVLHREKAVTTTSFDAISSKKKTLSNAELRSLSSSSIKAYQRSPFGAKMWNSHNLNSLYDNVVQYCSYVLLEFLVYRELSRLPVTKGNCL